MRLSRTRVQLSLWFTVVVFGVLTIVDAAFYTFLMRDARDALTAELARDISGVQEVIYLDRQTDVAEGELLDPIDETVTDVLSEWQGGPTHFLVYGANDMLLGTRGPEAELVELEELASNVNVGSIRYRVLGDHGRFALAQIDDQDSLSLRIVAARSTEPLSRYRTTLIAWMLVSIPAVTLLSLVAGYVLSGRALRPITDMGNAIAGIGAGDLDARLPVRQPPDEVDKLTEQVNLLLGRLSEARQRNHQFLSQAAHQIRTPLTIVRGEAELGLKQMRTADEHSDVLNRIRNAANQMSHRVDELFLLANAKVGLEPPVSDVVELDGLVFECTDLMRGRAQTSRHALEIERAEADVVLGNHVLLREALVELIENALRHGEDGAAVRVSGYRENGLATISVVNGGMLDVSPLNKKPSPGHEANGLGLSIVQWIAQVHGGQLNVSSGSGESEFSVVFPVSNKVS